MSDDNDVIDQQLTKTVGDRFENLEGDKPVPARKQYSSWGRKIDELMARRGMTLDDVAHQMKLKGYPVAHPKHALNRAMQKRHHKAITPSLTLVMELVLCIYEEEKVELWKAHQETGYESLRRPFEEHFGGDADED